MARSKTPIYKNPLIIAAALLLLLFVGVGAYGWAPDLPAESLKAKYASGSSQFRTIGGRDVVHLRIEGREDAQPLLMLHGSNASLHTWEQWVEELSDDFRLISVDLPGHGLTGPIAADDYSYLAMAQFIIALLNELNIDQTAIAGSSMGGAVAMQLAILAPERLTKLILVDAAGAKPATNLSAQTDRPLAFRLAATSIGQAVMSFWTPRAIVAQGLRKSFANQQLVSQSMIDRYFDLARFPGNRDATAKRFASYTTLNHELEPARITAPTLILWGDKDTLVPLQVGHYLQSQINGSSLKVYENVGHLPQEELAQQSAADTRAFLTQMDK